MNLLHKKTKLSLKKCLPRVFILCIVQGILLNTYAQNNDPKITLNLKQVSLIQLFSELENVSAYRFQYTDAVSRDTRKFSFSFSKTPMSSILDEVADTVGLSYKIDGTSVSVKPLEKKTISGKITDASTGEALPGVTVMIKGTHDGTVSDINGNYNINTFPNATLQFSFIGYLTREEDVKGRNTINPAMNEDAIGMEEVVVIGYGNREKSDLTGAVSDLKSKDFNSGINSTTEEIFRGKFSGVRIQQASGEPGSPTNIFIRGAGSVRSGNTPLFVVDGIPLSNEATGATSANAGFGTKEAPNPLNFLNPSDIASVSILKDASASAIYGSRGANGVVIITTRKGKPGDRISYDGYVGISRIKKKLDVFDASEFVQEAPLRNLGYQTDWQDEIFRTALTHSHNLSIGGSGTQNNKFNYRISLSHLDQEGIIEKSELERTGLRVNLNSRFLSDDRLSVGFNFVVSNTKHDSYPGGGNDTGSGGDLIINAIRANPTAPVYDENGTFFSFEQNATLPGINPSAMLEAYDDELITNRFLGKVDVNYTILKPLKYTFRLGVDKALSERNTLVKPNSLTDFFDYALGYFGQQNNNNNSTLAENILSFNQSWNSFGLKADAGYSFQSFKTSSVFWAVRDFKEYYEEYGLNPADYPQVGIPVSGRSIIGYPSDSRLQSYFLRTSIDYKNKYLLTLSARYDGSDRFDPDDNFVWDLFPSAALAWKINNEPFFPENNFISELKLRVSYGITGNQEIPNDATEERLQVNNNSVSVSQQSSNLKWEKVSQSDIGLDFSLLENRFHGTFDYFSKTTDNLILFIRESGLSTTSTWQNTDATIKNNGVEISIGGEIISNRTFSWNTDFNYSFFKNKISGLSQDIYTGILSGPGMTGTNVNIFRNGYSLGSFLLFDHIGFDENGNSIFRDVDKDGGIGDGDKIVADKNALPDFTLSLNSSFTYKNWSLSFNIIGEFGAAVYNNTRQAYLTAPGFNAGNNVPAEYLGHGQSLSDNGTARPSTFYLEDADFLRLNNLTLSHQPRVDNANWIRELKLYLTAQNLFVITDYSGYDPSVNTNKGGGNASSFGIDFAPYPSAKTLLLGLQIIL